MYILIVEDEIPAFEKLRSYLSNYFKSAFRYDWARSVVELEHFLASDSIYDFIISDIQLLDGHVFETYENRKIHFPIIFCSAYDEYLLKAFQSNGIAYILKPYTKEDIERAFTKYHTLFKNPLHAIEPSIFNKLQLALNKTETQYKSQFIIKNRKELYLLEVATIALIEAKGCFCKITNNQGAVFLYSQSIGNVYANLNPRLFFRINRSQLVQLQYIKRIQNHFKNRLQLTLDGVKEPVLTSSSTTADFRVWLDR